MKGQDCGEDVSHGCIRERIYCDDMKVSETTRGNLLPTPARRTHGSPDLDVLYVQQSRFFSIIPTTTILEFTKVAQGGFFSRTNYH